MRDEISMSVRDLVVAMLTVSDNVATDHLIEVAGLERINGVARALGLEVTRVTSDVKAMLKEIASEVGFSSYEALVAHEPESDGGPTRREIAAAVARSAALDPTRGWRTTPFETVALLQAIWTDRAGIPEASARVRYTMARQLTRSRIASGFDASTEVSAKSGGLLGVVRNEAGVVVVAEGSAYAVAVFTRRIREDAAEPALIDRAIGRVARALGAWVRIHR